MLSYNLTDLGLTYKHGYHVTVSYLCLFVCLFALFIIDDYYTEPFSNETKIPQFIYQDLFNKDNSFVIQQPCDDFQVRINPTGIEFVEIVI